MTFSLKPNQFRDVLEERANLLNSRPNSSKQQAASATSRYTTTYVIKKGYFNLVRYLLSTGADPNFVDEKEPNSRTSLIYATFIKDETWSLSVAQNLLEFGANLKQTDAKHLNPIHYCCAFGRVKLLELFLKSLDFDLSKALDSNGNSCLHYALRSHNSRIVSLIVAKFKKGHMTRVAPRNVFGIKPLELEDEDELKQLKEANKPHLLFAGEDSLDDCKQILSDYVLYLKEKQARKEKLAAAAQSDEKKKTKSGKKRKNSKKPGKTVAAATTSSATSGKSTARKRSVSSNKGSLKGSRSDLNETLPESIKEETPRIQTNLFFATELDDKSFTRGGKVSPKKPPKTPNSLIGHKLARPATGDPAYQAWVMRKIKLIN